MLEKHRKGVLVLHVGDHQLLAADIAGDDDGRLTVRVGGQAKAKDKVIWSISRSREGPGH